MGNLNRSIATVTVSLSTLEVHQLGWSEPGRQPTSCPHLQGGSLQDSHSAERAGGIASWQCSTRVSDRTCFEEHSSFHRHLIQEEETPLGIVNASMPGFEQTTKQGLIQSMKPTEVASLKTECRNTWHYLNLIDLLRASFQVHIPYSVGKPMVARRDKSFVHRYAPLFAKREQGLDALIACHILFS